MITEERYNDIIKNLNLITDIPEGMGEIQNDEADKKISYEELESIDSYEELNKLITYKNEKERTNYWVRRWLNIKIEQCDRYLFSQSDRVTDNPNELDQTYDFEIDQIKLDLKSTRIPKPIISRGFYGDIANLYENKYKKEIKSVLENPEEIIRYLYDNQSIGVRYSVHNRLFIITCDATSPKNYYNEFKLRIDYSNKEFLIKSFLKDFTEDMLINLDIFDKKEKINRTVSAGALFIVKYKDEILLQYGNTKISIL